MPVHSSVESDGRLYYQCGDTGKKYYFKMGNETARRAALKKAYAQCEAMEKSGYKEPTGVPRGELTSYGPVQSVLSEMRPPIQTQKRKFVSAAVKRKPKAKATPKSAITDITLKSIVEDEFAAPKAKRARKQPVSGLIAPRRKFVSEAVKRKPKVPPKKVNAVKVESKDEKDELDIKRDESARAISIRRRANDIANTKQPKAKAKAKPKRKFNLTIEDVVDDELDIKRDESAKPISKRRKANAVANTKQPKAKPKVKAVKVESKDEDDELDIKRSRKGENVGKLKKDVALTVVPPVDTKIEDQVKEEATEALKPITNPSIWGVNQTPLPGNLPPLGIPFALLPRQAYTEWVKQGPALQQPTSNALAPQSEWLRGGPSIEMPQTDINARRPADPEPWAEGLKYDSAKGEWKFH